MTTIGIVLDLGSTPNISTIYLYHEGYNMNIFKWSYWYKKDNKKETTKEQHQTNDSMEIALWEIKDVFDLETEEVDQVVIQKRKYAEIFKLRNKKK